jgi:hypothetical protein
VNLKEIKESKPVAEPHDHTVETISQDPAINIFTGRADQSLKKHIGQLQNDRAVHFITSGRFSMHDLLIYILNQTGPADVLVSTWSISEFAIRQIVQKHSEGLIRSIRFLIDPRVKVRNPNPLQMLAANFDYRLKACHAKVTLIWNEVWTISVVASANLTNNPRIERGIIFPFRDVFEFDHKWISHEINS